MSSDWLKNLKVGDRVMVKMSSLGPADWTILTVERLTKTLIITDDGRRWRRSDGHASGSRNYYFRWLEEFSQEKIDESRAERFLRVTSRRLADLTGIHYSEVPAELVEKYGETLEAIVQEAKEAHDA